MAKYRIVARESTTGDVFGILEFENEDQKNAFARLSTYLASFSGSVTATLYRVTDTTYAGSPVEGLTFLHEESIGDPVVYDDDECLPDEDEFTLDAVLADFSAPRQQPTTTQLTDSDPWAAFAHSNSNSEG